jgi:hypothetical protein
MARIDPLVDSLIEAGAAAAEIVDAVETFMAAAAAAGCVAYKTILAYRTGLAVDPGVDLAAAQRSFDTDTDTDLPVRRRAKPLRDLELRTALARAVDLGKPVQVHTGFGDSELRLAESDPTMLQEVLRTPRGWRPASCIHGSFPWHAEAAYLAASKPNVWVELSLSNLFAPAGTADRLLTILDVAPRGRILLGSDGHGNPETQWSACRVLQDSWGEVAQRLSAASAHADWIVATREALFTANARPSTASAETSEAADGCSPQCLLRHAVGANVEPKPWSVRHRDRAVGCHLVRRIDEIPGEEHRGRGHVSRLGERRQRAERQVARAADPGLHHAATPQRHPA